ncbi:hypothetical protein KSS87_007538 [Heliosperma pusillum]|nr:hypothetical protein KSS87_003749 [Heliosperma pusillum]KAH9612088.1 hypothetical protein KSS87_012316 [Heliosperma pusillum]KAH9624800.1 hypothetical protein KSS87_007538 [Heliosperma pusillum]
MRSSFLKGFHLKLAIEDIVLTTSQSAYVLWFTLTQEMARE